MARSSEEEAQKRKEEERKMREAREKREREEQAQIEQVQSILQLVWNGPLSGHLCHLLHSTKHLFNADIVHKDSPKWLFQITLIIQESTG